MSTRDSEDVTVIRFTVPSTDGTATRSSTSSSAIFQLRLGLCIAFLLIAIGLYLILLHPSGSSSSDASTETDNLPVGNVIPTDLLEDSALNVEELEEYEAAYSFLNDTHDRHQIPLFNLPLVYMMELKFFLPWKPSVDFGVENYTMHGKSRMLFTVAKTNKRVQVHTLELHVGEVTLEDDFGRHVPIEQISREYPHVLDVHTTNLLVENMNYTLFISFTGKISRKSGAGIFSSPYQADGQERQLLSTHGQTQHARRIFPCIDNPEAKARFEVKVIHPHGTTAVSNGMENNSSTDGEWTTTWFQQSPMMSTYLFALAVSDYLYRETIRNGVRLRVYVPSSNIEDASLAMECLPRILDFYEDYFQMPCPIDKLDIYAVPNLKVLAMENWGLIMVRSQQLFYNRHVTGPAEKKVTFEVLAHEIAHQWFGNLVTMKWWNNLWLNEGFATMMAHKAVLKLFGPISLAKSAAQSMRDDQTPASFPISRPDKPSFDPEEQFRTQYIKPSLLMRAVEKLVGEETFRAGVSRLLKQFAYKNVDHTDLMEALTYAYDSSAGNFFAGESFSLNNFIATWIYQPGYPLLNVTEREPGVHVVSQIAFRFFTSKGRLDKYRQWKVPIFLTHPVTKEKELKWLLENETMAVDLEDDYVLDGNNLFRILYSKTHYDTIIEQLHTRPAKIPEQMRSRLVDDSFTFAEHGLVSYNVPWNLTAYITSETFDAILDPTIIFSAHMDLIISRLKPHDRFDTVKKYFHVVLGHWFNQCNVEIFGGGDSSNAYGACEVIYKRLCIFGFPNCIEMARTEMKKLIENCGDRPLSSSCNHIPQLVRMPIYAAISKYGEEHFFNFLYEKFIAEEYSTERAKLWEGLVGSFRAENIHRLWYYFLFKNRLAEPFKLRCFDYSKHYHWKTHLISFIKKYMDKMIEELSQDEILLIFTVLSRSLFRQDEIPEFKEVADIAAAKFPIIATKIKGYTDRVIEVNKWRDLNGDYIIGNISAVLDTLEKRFIVDL